MIGRGGPKFGGQTCAPAQTQLLGVDANALAELLRPLEYAPRLVNREYVRFAKDIAVTSESFGCDSRKHFINHKANVINTIVSILVGNFMCPEKCWNQIERRFSV